MHYIVCVKQVPNTTEIKIDPKTNTLVREGVESILNPFDTYAIEEAVRLKEAHGGTVTAISMGPNQVEATLREAYLWAWIISSCSDRKFWSRHLGHQLHSGGSDQVGITLILTGQQAIDGDTAQVGPGIAAHLKLPQTCLCAKSSTSRL